MDLKYKITFSGLNYLQVFSQPKSLHLNPKERSTNCPADRPHPRSRKTMTAMRVTLRKFPSFNSATPKNWESILPSLGVVAEFLQLCSAGEGGLRSEGSKRIPPELCLQNLGVSRYLCDSSCRRSNPWLGLFRGTACFKF